MNYQVFLSTKYKKGLYSPKKAAHIDLATPLHIPCYIVGRHLKWCSQVDVRCLLLQRLVVTTFATII